MLTATYISVILFEVDIVAEQKQTYVYTIFHCPEFFYCRTVIPTSP